MGKMNNSNIDKYINGLKKFIESNDQTLLVTGNERYNKHKIIIKYINSEFTNKNILFRTNGFDKALNGNWLGFTGIKKKPKGNTFFKIGNNNYMVDSFLSKGSKSDSFVNFDFVIVYPIDGMLRESKFDRIEELYKDYDVGKVFLVTCSDSWLNKCGNIEHIVDQHLSYNDESVVDDCQDKKISQEK
ncbi:hypothetical protein PT159_08490 [Erysipelothrix rhusiopathiae]|nr:hypothetical protein [Erysipelothrix rhusiopathiae]